MDCNTSLALQSMNITAAERPTLFLNGDGVFGSGGGGMEMRRGSPGRGKPFSGRPSTSDQNNNSNLYDLTEKGFPGSRSVSSKLGE